MPFYLAVSIAGFWRCYAADDSSDLLYIVPKPIVNRSRGRFYAKEKAGGLFDTKYGFYERKLFEMKNRKLFVVLLALVLVFGAFAGCGNGGESSVAAQPIVLVDMLGRAVTLDGPADKIVVLEPAACEVLYAIGAGSAVIGRGEYCDYPAEVASKPSLTSGYETNIEQIIALGPQLVIMSKMGQKEEHGEALGSAGISVIVTDAQMIEDIYTMITLLGKATGKDSEASTLAATLRGGLHEIKAKVGDSTGKTVYFEVDASYGLWTTGGGTFLNDLAGILGLVNIFEELEGWDMVSMEQVIERDPDYIITTAMVFGDGPAPDEDILTRAGWENITAVKNGDVFFSDSDEVARPGPRVVEAARILYVFIYGPLDNIVPLQ